MKFVSIILGSKSDYEEMRECIRTLEKFGVPYEVIVASVHRSPERVEAYVKRSEKKGVQVFIAASGLAAHLAGMISAYTIKPVLGVPMAAEPLQGYDALLSTVMMPSGVPVGTLTIGQTGGVNAAYLAIEILALGDDELMIKLKEDRIAKAKKVELDSSEIEVIL